MGNTKSSNGQHVVIHERLDEHNPRYFARVHARNDTSDSPRRWKLRFKKRRPQSRSSVPLLAADSPSPERAHVYAQNYVGMMFSQEEADSPTREQSQKQLMGLSARLSPLDTMSTPTFNQAQHSSLSATRKPIAKLPSPREGPIRTLATESSVSTTTSGSTSRRRHKDYYTDMMDEANGESQDVFVVTKTRDAALQNFDATLPSGVVWAEISRSSKVTCFALSKSSEPNLLLAVGTADGGVAVLEVYSDGNSPRSVVSPRSGATKRVGAIREVSREGKIRCLDFSPDGQWLAVAGDDCTVGLIRLKFRHSFDREPILNALELAAELEREDRIYAVQFHPHGSLLAMGGYDGKVTIASFKESRKNKRPRLEILTEVARSGLVLCLDWSPDGMFLAYGGSDKCCVIVDDSWAETRKIHRPTSIHTLNWSPDGSSVALGGKDGAVCCVDVASCETVGEVVRGPRQERIGGNDAVAVVGKTGSIPPCQINSLCWSSDGTFLAIGGTDAACVIVESKTFTIVHEIRQIGSINCVSWEQKVLAVGGDDRAVVLFKTGRSCMEETDLSSISDSSFNEISSTGSSSLRVATSHGQSTEEWVLKDDFRDMDESFAHPSSLDVSSDDSDNVSSAVTAVAFSRAKKGSPSSLMAMASSNARVLIVSTKQWRVVKKLKFTRPMLALHFSRKGNFLALGGGDAIVYILSVTDWRVVKEMRLSSPVNTLRFSRLDEGLAIGSSDGLLTVLGRTQKWNVTGEMDESDAAIRTLDWSKTNLAVGRSDGSVTIHEAEQVHSNFFVPLAEFSRGNNAVNSVSFSVKGKYLGVGGEDKRISIYSAKGGWVLCHQIDVGSTILDVSWSSTGRYLGYCGIDFKRVNKSTCVVIDTLCWSEVDELDINSSRNGPAARANDDLSLISWSNNETFVLFAGRAGVAHVVDTETWQIVKSLTHTGELFMLPDHGAKPESYVSPVNSEYTTHEAPSPFFPPFESPAADTQNGDRDTGPRDNVKWSEIPLVTRFVDMSSKFLSRFEDRDPPFCLRVYVICMLMLEGHVMWVSGVVDSTSDGTGNMEEDLLFLDDGEPLGALLGILQVAAHVMTQVLENEDTLEEWWKSSTKFELTPKELRRLHAWNEQWRLVDARAPIVETNLLMTTDELKLNPIGADEAISL